MLTMMLILTAVSCAMEFRFTAKHPNWRVWLGEHRTIALILSVGLSVILGDLFGAAGLICFGAGLLSTIVMNGIYAVMPAIEKNRRSLNLMGSTFRGFFKVTFALILAPFKALEWVLEKFEVVKAAIAHK